MAGGMQGGPVYSAPVRKSGTSGCMVWGLVGCGALALIFAIGIGIAAYRFSKDPAMRNMISNIQSVRDCAGNLVSLQSALEKYTAAHGGKYPATLSELVPKYLPDKAALTCGGAGSAAGGQGMEVEYARPGPDTPPETPVISFRGREAALLGQRTMQYVRLLKDGRIVMDTVQRQEIPVSRLQGRRQDSDSAP
ncbi:MAG TPA: hypothetical protein VFB21_19715 [Chthonomonadaceae bacterium]|nr:hypothetical protein [Chthonomonadaceae bacterium]